MSRSPSPYRTISRSDSAPDDLVFHREFADHQSVRQNSPEDVSAALSIVDVGQAVVSTAIADEQSIIDGDLIPPPPMPVLAMLNFVNSTASVEENNKSFGPIEVSMALDDIDISPLSHQQDGDRHASVDASVLTDLPPKVPDVIPSNNDVIDASHTSVFDLTQKTDPEAHGLVGGDAILFVVVNCNRHTGIYLLPYNRVPASIRDYITSTVFHFQNYATAKRKRGLGTTLYNMVHGLLHGFNAFVSAVDIKTIVSWERDNHSVTDKIPYLTPFKLDSTRGYADTADMTHRIVGIYTFDENWKVKFKHGDVVDAL